MKNLTVMNKMTRTFSRVGLQLKKHSPEILVAAGVVGTVASTVMACKATTKLDTVLEESKKKIDVIHAATKAGVVADEPYSAEDGKKDLTIVYTQAGLKLAKLYAPAVIVGALSITAIISSHKILRTRNMALAAAYTAVDKGFKEYRQRVVERFGKDLDRELKYNIKAKEVEERVVDENGNETTVKKTVETADIQYPSGFAFFFDESCTGWDKDAEMNKFFLIQQQSYANDLLQRRGHLFLNEVLDMLGAQRTRAGSQVGWIYDPENPHINNFVDFGVYNQVGIERYDERKRAFANGHERSILIDPNVDGVIYDLLPERDGL